MTLRHRLLLVYLIVVFLSAATVGVAIFELNHAHTIMSDLQAWNGLMLKFEKLKQRWPPPPDVPPEELEYYDLKSELVHLFRFLAAAPPDDTESETLVVPRELANQVRAKLNDVYRACDQWERLPADQREPQSDAVRRALDGVRVILESELSTLNLKADTQSIRTRILLVIVGFLMLLHVVTIGSLLRRWLLWPMERLNRQVEALARDEAPSEPLLTSPREMARLALALDRARQSLGMLRQQLLDAERLTVIGQMAAQLAHNLRNPLANIRAAAQLTLRQTDNTDRLKERMTDIMVSVDRLNRWVMGLMEIARRDPTLTKTVDVVPTVQEAIQAVAGELAPKELVLTTDVPREGLVCAHDPATLEHALVAMLVNAIEASPLGGTIQVRVEPVEYSSGISVCRISVIDQGMGLPPDCPDRIFEFSYSTKQRGMGLGLALARQALKRQGGNTQAFNNPDGGATVCVELPRQREPVSPGKAEPQPKTVVSSAARN
ncbi:MAG TPA: HAMP domain-containing sensor histidine kinase [Phycisphaerae bacterium]|nr:HAMP domain-containing sensor histidine kinase [Phycisphaerae bacterium]HOJ72590.1 HAMP domain-containing sensor histidine kinase [Phycisphaerae bacterium]HOM49749.1 HAMP domain-containing sensor histidine kinase [Phycisphaerae bacterium]HON64959.1 HAMP domain-containing sensor histidine kinase [Phycisphaerae bacterium]HOQ84806.1 HAMP domain-containing sensor histidine kinase [Phycisphaerae bacterium]